jgi:hypothetical protein
VELIFVWAIAVSRPMKRLRYNKNKTRICF